jgi:hypothetical protein
MFKTLGIRTLMVCGVVTFIAQQPLVAQLQFKGDNDTEIKIEEGKTKTITYQVFNAGTSDIKLTPPRIVQSVHMETGTDGTDSFSVDPEPWTPNFILKPNAETPVNIVFTTPATFGEKENLDSGKWIANFFYTFDHHVVSGGNSVIVQDVVPESSTLILVGVCALSVCGFGWLRRRRTLSEV